MIRPSERDILIWLDNLKIGYSNVEKLYNHFDDLREIWTSSSLQIKKIKSIRTQVLDKIINSPKEEYLNELSIRFKSNNIDVITIFDEDYPKHLRSIDYKPMVLYKRGKLIGEDSLAIAIVGSRKTTSYGKWACEKFTKELVNMGVTIVSGLALGIDAVAHKIALDYGGRTIGVLGNGLDRVYPKKNDYLYNEIVKNGAILTEFSLGTQPLPYNFPRRNRIIAGLSLGIVVIEAKEKSGSLITAHYGLEQGKEIFALPGNINSLYSGGTNKLIKDGAKSLLDIDDIIEEIYELQDKVNKIKKEKISFSNFSETESKIIKIIQDGPIHCDMIAYKSGMDISTVISILTILELKGVIKELTSRTFIIC